MTTHTNTSEDALDKTSCSSESQTLNQFHSFYLLVSINIFITHTGDTESSHVTHFMPDMTVINAGAKDALESLVFLLNDIPSVQQSRGTYKINTEGSDGFLCLSHPAGFISLSFKNWNVLLLIVFFYSWINAKILHAGIFFSKHFNICSSRGEELQNRGGMRSTFTSNF